MKNLHNVYTQHILYGVQVEVWLGTIYIRLFMGENVFDPDYYVMTRLFWCLKVHP